MREGLIAMLDNEECDIYTWIRSQKWISSIQYLETHRNRAHNSSIVNKISDLMLKLISAAHIEEFARPITCGIKYKRTYVAWPWLWILLLTDWIRCGSYRISSDWGILRTGIASAGQIYVHATTIGLQRKQDRKLDSSGRPWYCLGTNSHLPHHCQPAAPLIVFEDIRNIHI